MKVFTKAALVAAIATAPMAGFAMESLEDEALSAVTGQDGISISIASTTIDYVKLIDQDGLDGAGPLTGGAIFISGISVGGATSIEIDADADTIQAAVTLGSGTLDLGVVSATATGASAGGTTLIDLGSMTHGDISLNVQLGTEDQGHMIVLSGTATGGISLAGFQIDDIDSTGAIGVNATTGSVSVVTNASTDLTLSGNINATASGLTIAGLSSMDVTLTDLILGSSTSMGDLVIGNLTVGTVTISGK